jgi:signal transduction histidine kinase
MGPLIRSSGTSRRPGIVARLREFEVDITPAFIKARADHKRLQQVLELLIDNAIKFTPHGTRIRLVVTPLLEKGESWVRIEVQDDGPGIAPQHLPSLFEPLRQIDGSTTRSVGGIGMGLALAREIVLRMGGRLEVESELGRGTRVRILLRAA